MAQALGATAGLGKQDVVPVPPEKEKETRENMACHQKSPQYVKVVSGRKRVKHIRG